LVERHLRGSGDQRSAIIAALKELGASQHQEEILEAIQSIGDSSSEDQQRILDALQRLHGSSSDDTDLNEMIQEIRNRLRDD